MWNLQKLFLQVPLEKNIKKYSSTSWACAGFAKGGQVFREFGRSHALARGVRGKLPRENIFKECNFVRFREYFDKILTSIYF